MFIFKTFISVNSDTNDGKVAILSSIILGGKRTFQCFCVGAKQLEKQRCITISSTGGVCPKMGNVTPLTYNRRDCQEDNDEPEARKKRI